MKKKTGWRGQSESQIVGEEKRYGRLVGAAETSKERPGWRRLQRKYLSILGLLKRKRWPRCHRESSWQVRQSCLCQKGKEQSCLKRTAAKEKETSISLQKDSESQSKKQSHLDELSDCTNQQPPQRGGAVLEPVWVGSKWLLAFPRVPVSPGTPLHFFAMLPPERPQKGSTQHLQNRSPVFTFSSLLPYSCSSSSPHSSSSPDEPGPSSQPWPHLSLLCVRWKRDLAGQVSAMLHLIQMGPSKVLITFPV